MKKLTLLLTGITVTLHSCVNPFAPRLAENNPATALLGDQRTVEGLFRNFRYAYTFRDTLVYSQLLHPDFTFIYRDYERSVDVSWGRNDEMRATAGLFRNAQSLDLTWNEIVFSSGDSTRLDVTRSFNLIITFNPADIVQIDGRVNFRLIRSHPDSVWKILRWRDESNF